LVPEALRGDARAARFAIRAGTSLPPSLRRSLFLSCARARRSCRPFITRRHATVLTLRWPVFIARGRREAVLVHVLLLRVFLPRAPCAHFAFPATRCACSVVPRTLCNKQHSCKASLLCSGSYQRYPALLSTAPAEFRWRAPLLQ
jgi:hypothetical protein